MEYKYKPGSLTVSLTRGEIYTVKKLVESEIEHCTERAKYYAQELVKGKNNIHDNGSMHEFFTDRVEVLTCILHDLTTSLK